MKMFSLKIIFIMTHRHEIVTHYSYENKEIGKKLRGTTIHHKLLLWVHFIN